MIKVVLIEDDFSYAHHLKEYLNLDDEISCQDVFFNAASAIRFLLDTKQNVDVVLVDVFLPDKTGIECIEYLSRIISTRFLIITNFENTDLIFSALKSGATGYLVKSEPPQNIIQSIKQIYLGGAPMSPQIARKVVESFRDSDKKSVSKDCEMLSSREREILCLLSDGYRYKEIGEKLFISPETVRTHIRNIYLKLQVNSKIEAINKVYKDR